MSLRFVYGYLMQIVGYGDRAGEILACLVNQGLRITVKRIVDVGEDQLFNAGQGGGTSGVGCGSVCPLVSHLSAGFSAVSFVDQ